MSGVVLAETRRAFDSVAPVYAQQNEDNALLSAMRSRVLGTLFEHVRPGAHVLDLGCGPGVDVERLALEGYWVTAVDWSPAMVREAVSRLAARGLSPRAEVRNLGIDDLDELAPARFDAVYSNFGPLNCVPSLALAASRLAARVRPGGLLIASVIGRVCPWEVGVFLARGQVARARVRFTRRPVPVPLNGRTVWTQYYTPARFERAFREVGFRRLAVRALALFAPPPYLDAFAARHPSLVRRLQALDDRLGARRPFRAWGDHFLIVMEKL